MGAEIAFKRPDGGDAKGYLTNAARGDAPGVVVIQEWWGLAEQIKALVDRFALAGFDALAPTSSTALSCLITTRSAPRKR